MDKTNKSYTEKLEDYISKIKSNDYSIQILISKSCNYSFLLHINKNSNLSDLYKLVSLELNNNGHNKLYKSSEFIDQNLIPNNNIIIYDYIKSANIKPYYDMPSPVVYKIWLDDGYNHNTCCRNI